MRIAMVVTPLSDANLRLAAQIGVTDIVARYPGSDLESVRRVKEQVEKQGLRLTVIEGYLPMEQIRLGQPGRDAELEQIKELVRSMGKLGVSVLCYNFMAYREWTRTVFNLPERGGALVNGFDIDHLKNEPPAPCAPTTDEQIWTNLRWFLERIVPVAEDANVRLAMHPDDPPMSPLFGLARIMRDLPAFERLVNIKDSPSNGICFCGGCFSEMGLDVPATIRRLGRKIVYAHFRDVCGCVPRFRESFHDNGQTNMAEAMRAYRDIGFTGVMRPDHVPRLEGEAGEATGYTMLGRLFAVGYMRGLMHALQ